MNNVVRRFGQRGAAAAEDRQEPAARLPDFLVHETGEQVAVATDARLRDLRENMVIPPAEPAPMPEPLHPDVAKLINRGQLEAARQMGDEHVRTAQAIFDEAAAHLEEAKQWRARAYEATEAAAIAYATLHARQRRAHEGMAAVRAEYLAEELPAPPAAEPPAAVAAEPAPAAATGGQPDAPSA